MNYQALARKWRPRNFQEVVGQTVTVRALSNALNHQQLHHAYLFTGTRGVGKTSLARILAKCFSCETGITSNPCGQCSICQAIDAGSFPDLLEIDAASNTRVEDTRELLEQVMYAPTQGRYKIYLIDEVHMLSTHSFNALLKTLEEPPAHVKFLLATTNPEKLPVTILSRCLAFALKPLSVAHIVEQLTHILQQEQMSAEPEALTLIAEQADGSLRDALSLLDQALAYSEYQLTKAHVRALLGLADSELLLSLLQSIAQQDKTNIQATLEQLALNGADFAQVLDEMLHLLHQIAWQQQLKLTTSASPKLAELAQTLSPEQIQLFYQIILIGRRDLPLTPSSRLGFEMTILRLLAFTLVQPDEFPITQLQTEHRESAHSPPMANHSLPGSQAKPIPFQEWNSVVNQLKLTGISLALAKHCSMRLQEAERIELVLAKEHAPLLNQQTQLRIQKALSDFYQRPIQLNIQIGTVQTLTPAAAEMRRQKAYQTAAEQHVSSDATIQALQNELGASIIPNSIQPISIEENENELERQPE